MRIRWVYSVEEEEEDAEARGTSKRHTFIEKTGTNLCKHC